MMKVMVWRCRLLSQGYKLQLHLLSCCFPIVVVEILLQFLRYLWLKLTRLTALSLVVFVFGFAGTHTMISLKELLRSFLCKSHSCKLEAPSNESAPLHPTFAPYNCWNLLGMEDCNVDVHHCVILLPLTTVEIFWEWNTAM